MSTLEDLQKLALKMRDDFGLSDYELKVNNVEGVDTMAEVLWSKSENEKKIEINLSPITFQRRRLFEVKVAHELGHVRFHKEHKRLSKILGIASYPGHELEGFMSKNNKRMYSTMVAIGVSSYLFHPTAYILGLICLPLAGEEISAEYAAKKSGYDGFWLTTIKRIFHVY